MKDARFHATTGISLAVALAAGLALACQSDSNGGAEGATSLASSNPCAAKTANPCNPCGANPCNPCAGKTNPCNPCASKVNPCNPCAGAANPCNPCGANPCNPCAGKANPCNPCAGKANPCNPCAGKANPCNPCGGARVDPARFQQPAGATLASGSAAELLAEGERLWNDRSLGRSGLACGTCHFQKYAQMKPGFARPYPHAVEMVQQQSGVAQVNAAEMVQFCMLQPMQAEPLAWTSRELAALTAWVKHIQPGYRPMGGTAPNPCNPCAGKTNPCGANPCNPCAAKGANPCNPCGG